MDVTWGNEMASLGNLDLLAQAEELGRLAAHQRNKMADTGGAEGRGQ